MAIFKCKMCGGTLEINNNETVAECQYCGTKQTLPRLDDDKKANLYDRANHFRRGNDFDKAMAIYEQILNEDGSDAEAYWSLVLCRYGIEYVEDPQTHKRVPTVNRAQFTSIFADEDYKSALQYADDYQKSIYEEEAKAIDEIQKGILAISQKEEPFDVFICYKETDNNGRRTQDSVLANDLYHQLTQEGFKVFFSRITLEDKLGSAYEPYIFAALNSAKVMVAIGTKAENFQAVWVKNEWSRFLALMKKDSKKTLIPAYRDMDPYDLPEEFSHLQAQDMSKLGFMQDLIRGIKKILDGSELKQTAIRETVVGESAANTTRLLKRVFMFLDDEDWQEADAYCEKVLDVDPENGEAYVGKLCAERHYRRLADLLSEPRFWAEGGEGRRNKNYQKILRFGDPTIKKEVEDLLAEIQGNVAQQNEKLAEKRRKLATASKMIAADRAFFGVKLDGTVVATKYIGDPRSYSGSCDVSGWTDIVAIEAHPYQTVGLRADGTVVATKFILDSEYYNGQCDVSGWTDIVAIATCEYHTFGLRADGTVVATKFISDHQYYVKQFDVSGWTDIVAITACNTRIFGLKANGTVIGAKYIDTKFYADLCDISGWTDIVAITASETRIFGLKANGTVIWEKYEDDRYDDSFDVSNWTDIIAIAPSSTYTIGLKADGTVVATKYILDSEYYKGQCDVSGWTDIVAIANGITYTAGLRADGTVVTTGSDGQGEDIRVGGEKWRLFHNIDTLEEERIEIKEKQKIEQERQRIEELEQKRAVVEALKKEKVALEAELPTLKGLFAGKRRKEIETRLEEIQQELNRN